MSGQDWPDYLRTLSDAQLVDLARARGLIPEDDIACEARLEAELIGETDPLMIESMIADKRRDRG